MSSITIQKSAMKEICAKIMAEKTLYAPMSNGKVNDFLPVDDANNILMGDEITYKSPKELFFPQSEVIIKFTATEAIATAPQKGVVVFGVRPCDLEAIKVIKSVFTTDRQNKFKDPYFQAHYDNTVLIGVGCKETKPGCFCKMRETDMTFSDQCDLFLENKDDAYEVIFVSEKGKAELGKYIDGLANFTNPAREKKTQNTLDISKHENELELFDKINWDEKTEVCQGCGMCTFICPTCHCFGFKDVATKGDICRYRNWDSCMFPKFTLHASGHNPRESKTERYRQRVLHKYVYVKKNFGHVACTGCGRCIRSCPTGMNINQIVSGIMEELS